MRRGAPWFKSLDPYGQNMSLSFVYSAGAGWCQQRVEDDKKMPPEHVTQFAEPLLEQGLRVVGRVLQKEYVSSRRQKQGGHA